MADGLAKEKGLQIDPDGAAQFPNEDDQITFITAGSEQGKKYGQQGQGSGRMPGFGAELTPEQIKAIVEYERNL